MGKTLGNKELYFCKKNNSVWEITLNIANTKNGEKVLYEIFPIKKVERAGTSATSTTNNNISQTFQNSQDKNNSIQKQRKVSSVVAPGRNDVVVELAELYRQEEILQKILLIWIPSSRRNMRPIGRRRLMRSLRWRAARRKEQAKTQAAKDFYEDQISDEELKKLDGIRHKVVRGYVDLLIKRQGLDKPNGRVLFAREGYRLEYFLDRIIKDLVTPIFFEKQNWVLTTAKFAV